MCSQDLEERDCITKKKSHFSSILYRVIKKLRQDASNRYAVDVQNEALCLRHLAPVLGVEEVGLMEVGLLSTHPL